jgi:hypothetical protein
MLPAADRSRYAEEYRTELQEIAYAGWAAAGSWPTPPASSERWVAARGAPSAAAAGGGAVAGGGMRVLLRRAGRAAAVAVPTASWPA